MKKIIIAILMVVAIAFASETDNGIVNVTKNKYGTEMTFYPNTSLDGIGHVYSIIMNDCYGFKSVEVKFMDGTVQYYSFDEEKMPSVTTKHEDRVLSWESLTKPKFMKAWNNYYKFFKDHIG
jgi:hypothetical protein